MRCRVTTYATHAGHDLPDRATSAMMMTGPASSNTQPTVRARASSMPGFRLRSSADSLCLTAARAP